MACDAAGTEPTHRWPFYRACNILARTAHLIACGVLAGGHAFHVDAGLILPWTWAAVLTGVLLMIIEAYPTWRYVLEGRGLMVAAKLILLCLIPVAWSYRVPILIAVMIIGSVGSHMPRKYRHYSIF